jgi:hypothetical protein
MLIIINGDSTDGKINIDFPELLIRTSSLLKEMSWQNLSVIGFSYCINKAVFIPKK